MMSFNEFKKEVVLAMEQRIGEGNAKFGRTDRPVRMS